MSNGSCADRRIIASIYMQRFIKTLQERVAGFLIFMMLVTSVFVTPSAYAATYYFTQTNWSGGNTSATSTHPTNQTGWTQYSTSTNIATSSNSLRLSSSTGAFVQTSEANATSGFAYTGYASSNVAIVGTGSGASLQISTSSPSVYYSSGTYTSAVLDLGGGADFTTLSWNATTTASTTRWMQTDDGTGNSGFNLSGNTKSNTAVTGTGSSASVALAPLTIQTGDGGDGSVTFSVNTNLTTDDTVASIDLNGVSPDGFTASLTTDVAAGATVMTVSSSSGFVAGDEVMLIQSQHSSNGGKYEIRGVGTVDSATQITLTAGTTNAYYGAAGEARVIRVPNYTTVTIDASVTLTASAYSGVADTSGIIVFKATGAVAVNGTINADALGYAGGANAGGSSGCTNAIKTGYQGSTYTGTAGAKSSAANAGGGGGGSSAPTVCTGGAGGGYGAAGSSSGGATGGESYGNTTLSTIFLGSGGGAGGGGSSAGAGATGGGIVFVTADTLTVNASTGAITAAGGAGVNSAGANGSGGGGAGGSVYIVGNTLTLNTTRVTAAGGAAGTSGPDGGAGAVGRIYAEGAVSGTTSPAATTATYYSSGTYTSPVKAVGSGTQFGAISWTSTLPSDTSLTLRVSTCDDSACSGEVAIGSASTTTSGTDISSLGSVTDGHGWVQYQATLSTTNGTVTPSLDSVTINHDALAIEMQAGTSSVPDGTWTGWQTIGYGTSSSPASLGATFDGNRYAQYRVNLATVDASSTPSLNDITIDYIQYAASGTLVSSPYNSTDAANVFDTISWTESATTSARTVRLQVRSSSTEAGLDVAPWCGYADCSGSTYVTSSKNGVSFASDHSLKTGANDQWLQYKVTLNSDGIDTPVLSAVTSTYVVNAAPAFDTTFGNVNGVSSTIATSTTDSLWGKMRVQYKIKDEDTVTASTTVSLDYSTSSGSVWTSIGSSALGSGDLDDKVVSSSSYTQYSATWNPATSSANQYSANAQFRITINDGEVANNITRATSTFTFDTKKPTINTTSTLINSTSSSVNTTSSAITLGLQGISGDASTEWIHVRFASSSVWYGANASGTLTANSWGSGFSVASSSQITWPWTLQARLETITTQVVDSHGNGSDATVTDTNSAGYNDTPGFDPSNAVTAHQIATSSDANWGKVAITYYVRDTDTNIGAVTPGYVSSSFEYSTSTGSPVWNTIGASSLSAGAMSTTSVSTSAYTSSTVYWDVKTDVAQKYYTNMKIRVTTDDHEPILNTASTTTSVFTIDSKNPVNSNPVLGGATTTIFDAGVAGSTSTAVITVYKQTDDSTLYYQLSSTSTESNASSSAWTEISNATTSVTWTFDSDIEPKGINVRFRDVYGNYMATSTVSTISPSSPSAFLIQDVSKVSTADWRMYVAWETATSSLFDAYILEYATSSNGTTFGSSSVLTTISAIDTNYYVHLNLSSSTYYKYRLGVRDDNQNITVRSTAGTTGKPDGVQNNDEGGGGTSPRAATVTQVLPTQGSDGNVTVTYKLTDGSYTTKTSPSYEAYLFYNIGVVASGTSPYNEGAGTLALSSASNMASSGIIQVNNEVMQYTGKSGNTLTGITRGTWPTLNSSGRTTRSNSSFLDGTPVWVKASSTSDIAVTATAAEIQSGYDCTGSCAIVWTMSPETGLAGNSFSNVGIRVLVHDNQTASSSPLSSQNDLSENGTLSTLDVTTPTIYFSTSTMSGAESVTAATATIQLARAYPRDVTVVYTITGTATIGAGNDFTVANSSSTTGTSTIAAGATSTTVGIQVTGDSTSEANETIILTLSSPVNATVGSTSTLTYTIADDDTAPTIYFSSSSLSGAESVTPAVFTIVLSGVAGQAVEFTYSVSSTASTATGSGADYTLANGTSSITAGATSTTINATIVNDSQNEPNETLTLVISAPTGATLGATSTATYTILDDETLPEIYFVATASSGAESVTPVNIRILLSAVSGQDVQVGYALVVASTTAVLGTDYTLAGDVLTSGTSTITAGNTSTTLALQITDDSTGESSETIKLSLSGAASSTVGATSTFFYTITDNDNSAPQFDASFGTNGILVSQVATSSDANYGKVRVEYSFRDTTSATATPSFAYSLDNGTNWTNISSGAFASGDTNGKSATSTYTTSTATWSVSSTLPLTYASSAKIRVTLDDGDTHNNTTSSISAAFSFDALRATSSVILNSADNVIQSTISDNSSFQYRFSNNANMSADSMNASSGVWQAFSATSTTASSSWTFATSTGYEIFYYETSDAYGNNVSSTAVVAPSEPTNFGLRDVSDVTTNKYQEFFVWDAYTAATTTAAFSKYELYRSTSSNSSGYSLLTTITSASTNYHTDTSLSSSTTYYYRLRTVDTDGDISGYATSVSDMPDGQGGTDVTGPTLTSVSSTEVQTTWAKITWYASEFSDSKVEYSTSSGVFTSSTSNTSMISSSTQHSLVISNLTADTTYYFRVTSKDAFNNSTVDSNGGSGYSLTTLGGPRITAVAVRDTTDEAATIIWNTDRDSDSIVEYSTNSSLSSYTSAGSASLVGGSSTSTYPHSVSLTGLTKATRYYFRVKSTDASSTLSIDNNNGSFYSFSTTNDKKAPVISSIATPLITANAAVISWATDEPSTSQVEFGLTASTTTGSYSTTTTRDNTLTRTHIVSITGLSAVTPYYFRVKSYDMNVDSPTAVSDEQTFTTPTEKETITIIIKESSGGGGGDQKDTTPPAISNIAVSTLSAFEAIVSFDTSEDATGYVLFSKDLSFKGVAGSPSFVTKHTVTLSGLQLGTTYNFKVKAQDKSGNFTTSEAKTFTTEFAAEALDDLTKLENAAQFQEQLENIIESTLPSLVPPFIAGIEVADITENSAVVVWRTNVPAYSSLAYAPESVFNASGTTPYVSEVSKSDKKTNNHRMELTGLSPATSYHFQVKSFSIPGVVGKSADRTFSTKASKIRPEITRLGNIDIEVRWVTEEETSSFVDYRNLRTGKLGKTGDPARGKIHLVKVEGLEPATSYEIKVYGYGANDVLVEGDPLTATTRRDTKAPAVSGLRVDNALLPGRSDRLQAVISWKTDEPASSVVYFEEGVGLGDTLVNKVGQEREYTTDHIVIVTAFKPSTVYRMRVASSDESGNLAQSPIRTILTPRSAESVFDIVTRNLEDTFGFLKNIRQ